MNNKTSISNNYYYIVEANLDINLML